MQKFLRSVAIFLLPVFLAGLAAELYITFAPNTFNVKSAYQKSHLSSVELLAFGSSHNQNGINPEFFSLPAMSLAYGGQDITLDSALFFRYADQMKKLRYVILEFDYHSLDGRNNKTYFRLPWYYRYYGIEPYPVPLVSKISLYLSSMSFFNNYLFDQLNPLGYDYTMNEWGYTTNDFPGVFEDLNYDENAIAKDAATRLKNKHTYQPVEDYELNKKTLRHIIDYCEQHHIRIVLLSTPAHHVYRDVFVPEKNERRKVFLDTLRRQYPSMLYLDFESDSSFTVRDFKNEDHLNPRGAEKLTRKINDLIVSQ